MRIWTMDTSQPPRNHQFQTQIETENESAGFSLTLMVLSFQIINNTPNIPKESTTTKSWLPQATH